MSNNSENWDGNARGSCFGLVVRTSTIGNRTILVVWDNPLNGSI